MPSNSDTAPQVAVTKASGEIRRQSRRALDAIWRQLEADSCRVILFDLQTQEPLCGRWIRENGSQSVVLQAAETGFIFQTAGALTSQLAQDTSPSEQKVLVQMLNPRRWLYLWRLNASFGMMVQLQYLDSQDSSHQCDTEGLQVLCKQWMGKEIQAEAKRLAPKHVEPPTLTSRAAPSSKPVMWFVIAACVVGSLLMALWLFWGAANVLNANQASQQRELVRLSEVADNGAVISLSEALSSGDYGVVQDVLSSKATTGHFTDAAVTNSRDLVVAMAGTPAGLRIGIAVPPNFRAAARVLPLDSGNGRLGDLLIVRPVTTSAPQADLTHALRLVSAAFGALLLAAAAALLWRKAWLKRNS